MYVSKETKARLCTQVAHFTEVASTVVRTLLATHVKFGTFQ